ncbi:CAP domain-containing protein [Candidatus Nomurabacteria bacterium]|nr:CAP domain-containing protein [Candidatus Nomurabacteria bacterium]
MGFFKDTFIPHEGNDHKPHSLQSAAVVGMTFLVFLTFAVANLQSLVWTASEWMVSTILPAVIISDTNKERASDDLVPLAHSDVLDTAAQMKANDMATRSYFAHDAPDGTTPWYWFKQAGYSYVHAGENLAVHFTDSSEVVDAWMASPSHRANIMNGDYREIGIGVAKGEFEGFDTIFVVQLFGAPAVAAASVVAQAPAPAPVAAQAPPNTEPVTTPSVENVIATTPAVAGDEEVVTVSESEEAIEPTPTSTTELTATLATEEVTYTDDGTVVFSSYISTSTNATPATVRATEDKTTKPILAIATQPHRVLQIMYILIGLFVAVALTLSIVIEIRRQEPLQIAYGVGLIGVMLLLFYVHISVSSGVVIM